MKTLALLLVISLVLPQVTLAAQSPAETATLMARMIEKLPAGTPVKLRLTSGRKLRGILLDVEGNQVTIKPKTRLPEPAQVIPIETIDTIELEHGGSVGAGKAILIGVAAGAGAFFGLLLLALAAVAD